MQHKSFLVLALLISLAVTLAGCNRAATNSNATAANTNPPAAAPAASATKAPDTIAAKPAESNAAKPVETAKDTVPDGEFDGEPTFEEEKIKFPRGATDTTIEQTLAPGVNKTFLANAKKGQIMWFKVTESTGKISIDFNKNSVKVGEEIRQSLNSSGEWAIYVNNPTNKPLKYSLWVGIE